MKLVFPGLGGGSQQGLNDAGVENFLGAIDSYLVRECGQNTGDAARSPDTVTCLEFERLALPRHQIPAFDDLAATMDACLDKWRSDSKSRAFFEKAAAAARAAMIPVLRISDHGTTGLTGSDTDEQGRWFALVKSQGVSNKGETAGGSFGIGKSSPFAASAFRTVFYGTRLLGGEVAFQGVSRLVTHKGTNGKLTQGVGFIGDYDSQGDEGEPVFRAVRREHDLPAPFRRTDPGTDIWIMGYNSGADWAADLVKSILRDFWPAIHFGKIEFRVDGQRIGRRELPTLMDHHASDEEFDAHQYYRAVLNEPITRLLPSVGQCELYLRTARSELPRRICMTRQSGMRIYDYAPRACRVPFTGLFFCTDNHGNSLLRRLEPPRHDTWDPKRGTGTDGKRALDQIKGWIRDEVKKLNPLFAGANFNEDEVAKYLPDPSPEDDSPLPADGTGATPDEQLTPRARPLTTPRSQINATPAASPAGTADDGGVGTDGNGGVPPHSEQGGADDRREPTGGRGGTRPPPIRARAFARGPGRYRLVIRSDEPFDGGLVVRAMGEDGTQEPVQLASVVSVDRGTEYPFAADRINNVRLAANAPWTIEIQVAGASRRALTIVAVA